MTSTNTAPASEPSVSVLIKRYWAEIDVFNNTHHASDEEPDPHAEITYDAANELIGVPAIYDDAIQKRLGQD